MATALSSTETQTEPEASSARFASAFRPYRITVDRYERMIAAGVFNEKDPVFLWKGMLVEKMSKGRPHIVALTQLYLLMTRIVPVGWHVEQEQPLILSDDTEPEPDLKVVRGALKDYPDHPPSARDVPLVIEVADSSLAVDSKETLITYASESVPVYWLVNIPKARIEVYSNPTGPTTRPSYTQLQSYGFEHEVPVVLDGREVGRIAVRDILP